MLCIRHVHFMRNDIFLTFDRAVSYMADVPGCDDCEGGGSRAATHDEEEEVRCTYVALTRAQTHLYLTWAGRRMTHGRTCVISSPVSRSIPCAQWSIAAQTNTTTMRLHMLVYPASARVLGLKVGNLHMPALLTNMMLNHQAIPMLLCRASCSLAHNAHSPLGCRNNHEPAAVIGLVESSQGAAPGHLSLAETTEFPQQQHRLREHVGRIRHRDGLTGKAALRVLAAKRRTLDWAS